MASDNLKSLITPSLLTLLAEAQVPHSKTAPLDFSNVVASMYGPHFRDTIGDSKARDALVALSRLSPDGTPPPESTLDLMSFLPPPSSPDFPQQCFGLQLLFDHASRVLLDGIDDRWQSAYFGPLARRLAGHWYALPDALRPDSRARWRDDVGVASFDHWLICRISWLVPFFHDEDLESQNIGLEICEETRALVEAHTGVADPHRATKEELLKDDTVFPQILVDGPPKPAEGESISISTWAFWWLRVLDSHWPIIKRFGRYPYRNAILGRQNTAEEEAWLDDNGHIAEAPPQVADRIRRDVESGRFTPL